MHLHLSFHDILFLAYTIPAIYVFLRIMYQFIGKEYRLLYAAIFLLLLFVYPLGGILQESIGTASALKFLSGYLLPFFLYLFLIQLMFDIFLLVNMIFKIIKPEKLKQAYIRKISLVSIICMSLIIVTGGIINFNTIRISDYTIEIPRKSSELDHLRIAFAADFHLQERTGIRFVRKFAAKIEEINPDILIFGGDIIEGDDDDGNVKEYETILRGIRPRYGVFAVLGNHEYYAGQDKGSFFDISGIKVLCDTIMVFDRLFSLAGRYDSHFGQRQPVEVLLRSSSDSLPLILVDHRPTEIDDVSLTNADIQLSGHTHNGQLFPINLITRKVYELSWGHMKKGNTHFFVTSGIRLWGPPVRTTGKSEIMVIDVNFRTD